MTYSIVKIYNPKEKKLVLLRLSNPGLKNTLCLKEELADQSTGGGFYLFSSSSFSFHCCCS